MKTLLLIVGSLFLVNMGYCADVQFYSKDGKIYPIDNLKNESNEFQEQFNTSLKNSTLPDSKTEQNVADTINELITTPTDVTNKSKLIQSPISEDSDNNEEGRSQAAQKFVDEQEKVHILEQQQLNKSGVVEETSFDEVIAKFDDKFNTINDRFEQCEQKTNQFSVDIESMGEQINKGAYDKCKENLQLLNDGISKYKHARDEAVDKIKSMYDSNFSAQDVLRLGMSKVEALESICVQMDDYIDEFNKGYVIYNNFKKIAAQTRQTVSNNVRGQSSQNSDDVTQAIIWLIVVSVLISFGALGYSLYKQRNNSDDGTRNGLIKNNQGMATICCPKCEYVWAVKESFKDEFKAEISIKCPNCSNEYRGLIKNIVTKISPLPTVYVMTCPSCNESKVYFTKNNIRLEKTKCLKCKTEYVKDEIIKISHPLPHHPIILQMEKMKEGEKNMEVIPEFNENELTYMLNKGTVNKKMLLAFINWIFIHDFKVSFNEIGIDKGRYLRQLEQYFMSILYNSFGIVVVYGDEKAERFQIAMKVEYLASQFLIYKDGNIPEDKQNEININLTMPHTWKNIRESEKTQQHEEMLQRVTSNAVNEAIAKNEVIQAVKKFKI